MTPSGFSIGTILKMNVSRRSCKQESKDHIDSNSNFFSSLLELNPSKFQMSSSRIYVLCFLGWINLKHTAISKKVVGKNVHATIPESNMGYDQYTVPDDCSCRTYFCCFPLTLSNIRPGLSCHSFKFLWRKVHSKPPTIRFGTVAYNFSDNLSRHSCMRMPISLASWDSFTVFKAENNERFSRTCVYAKNESILKG